MPFAIAHGFTNGLARILLGLPGFQEAKVFGPRNIYEQFQAVLGGQIKKPGRRNIIESQQVGAHVSDLRKIARSLFKGSERASFRIGRERTVGDALEEELGWTQTKKFPVHCNSG